MTALENWSTLPLDQQHLVFFTHEKYFTLVVSELIRQKSCGVPALSMSAQFGLSEPVKLFINAGAVVDEKTEEETDNETTALVWACVGCEPSTNTKNGYLETVNSLIKAGASLNEKRYGYTALWHAAMRRSLEVVKVLIGAGATLDKDTYDLISALALYNYPEIAKVLREAHIKQSSKVARTSHTESIGSQPEIPTSYTTSLL